MASVMENALHAFATDPQAANRCRQHAAGFSWRATAEGYASVYASLLAEGGGNRLSNGHRQIQAG